MPLEINASKIVNTVTFKIDNKALKQAKDSLKSVKDFAESIQPSMNMTKFKMQMKELEEQAKKMAELNRQMRGGGSGTKNGTIPPSSGPTSSSKPPKGSGDTAAKAARRAEIGSLRQENFDYRSSNLGRVNAEQLREARDIVLRTVESFKNEEISQGRLNQLIAHQLDMLRQIQRTENSIVENAVRSRRREKNEQLKEARRVVKERQNAEKEQQRLLERQNELRRRERERRLDRTRESVLGLNPTALAGGLIGAAVMEGVSRIRELLSGTAERINLVSRGAQNVQANPNALLAMQYWGQQNGVDSANIKKAIDNVKDVRERLGNTELNSTLNPKTGKWTGGDQGVNNIMDTFGWNKEMIAKYQNNPLDFIGAVVNEGQRRGMNSAQIGRLMENLGDDLMHYERMFEDSGKGFIDTLNMMKATGAALTDEQIAAAQNYTMLASQLSMISEGMGANFLTGFMDMMGKGQDFTKNVQALDDGARWLGQQVGDLAIQFGNLITMVKEADAWFTRLTGGASPDETKAASNALNTNRSPYTDPSAPWNHTDPAAVENAADSAPTLMTSLSDWWNDKMNSHFTWTGLAPNDVPDMFTNAMNGTTNNGVGYQNPNSVIQVTPQINIVVQPDSGDLGLRVQAQLNDALDDYNRQTTLNTMSATSAYGF